MNSACLIFNQTWVFLPSLSTSLPGFLYQCPVQRLGSNIFSFPYLNTVYFLTPCGSGLAQSATGYLRKLSSWRGPGEGVGHHGAEYVQVIVVLACARATVVSWYSCWCVCDRESRETGFTGGKYVTRGRKAETFWHIAATLADLERVAASRW